MDNSKLEQRIRWAINVLEKAAQAHAKDDLPLVSVQLELAKGHIEEAERLLKH